MSRELKYDDISNDSISNLISKVVFVTNREAAQKVLFLVDSPLRGGGDL